MGLVDYSDSESDDETPKAPSPAPAPAPKPTPAQKPATSSTFKKVAGRIVVNLPSQQSTDGSPQDEDGANEERPAKRARTTGGSVFAGFNALLPAPKNRAAMGATGSTGKLANSSGGGGGAPPPRFSLKTSAAPGFSRSMGADGDEDDGDGANGDGGANGASGTTSSILGLPPPRVSGGATGPTIPAGQAPADQVKLVGKPLMFKPLSVVRKAQGVKKKVDMSKVVGPTVAARQPVSAPAVKDTTPATANGADGGSVEKTGVEEAPKKVSLFSYAADDDDAALAASDDGVGAGVEAPSTASYGPLYAPEAEDEDLDAIAAAHASSALEPTSTADEQPQSLASIAQTMQLTPAEQRALYGRHGAPSSLSSSTVTTFDVSAAYAENEATRAAMGVTDEHGTTGGKFVQSHNPLRAIQPGKHSLRQLVNAVRNQREALEENFARQKGAQRESRGRYGWR